MYRYSVNFCLLGFVGWLRTVGGFLFRVDFCIFGRGLMFSVLPGVGSKNFSRGRSTMQVNLVLTV